MSLLPRRQDFSGRGHLSILNAVTPYGGIMPTYRIRGWFLFDNKTPMYYAYFQNQGLVSP